MRVSFPTNDLGAQAFIRLPHLASCGISCWAFWVILSALYRLDQITDKKLLKAVMFCS